MNSIHDFDAILYINLSHRTDRKEYLLNQLFSLGISKKKIHRIDAVYTKENGSIGCAKSHFKALSYALANQFENVLILEDDVHFTKDENFINEQIRSLYSHIGSKWDAVMFGGIILEHERLDPFMGHKTTKAVNAQAYAVNKHYFEPLLLVALESYTIMNGGGYRDPFSEHMVRLSFDRRWNALQKKDNWFFPKTLFCDQKISFSDITCTTVTKGRATSIIEPTKKNI